MSKILSEKLKTIATLVCIIFVAFLIVKEHKSFAQPQILDLEATLFANELDYTSNYTHTRGKKFSKKPWTFIVYIAADNDLRNFSVRNIKQMATIGSNEYINIVVQIDIRLTRDNKITRRYFIEKNKITHVNANDPHSQRMDSGNPKTLISCCNWAINDYPADNYALILWNHGTGCLDPVYYRAINPMELFTFNSTINKLELDRSVGYLDLVNKIPADERGICWDDVTGNFLTNQTFEMALKEICTKILHGKKLSIIGFDACFMSMVEIGNMTKKYAHIMVGSQEVELGIGWDYLRVLTPFLTGSIDKFTFAAHIVQMFESTYSNLTNDYTLSAVNLDAIDSLENNIDVIAQLLLKCLKKQKNMSVKNAIKLSSSRVHCTHFDEPSYKDLHHLYSNLLTNLKYFSLIDKKEEGQLKSLLSETLTKGITLIETIVFENRVGKNLKQARGLSIYLPERKIHSSYPKTTFAHSNAWLSFIQKYITC